MDPTTSHFHILNPINKKLYEITLKGQVVAVRKLSEMDLSEVQGMVFAPSGDLTDDPLEVSLYITDGGSSALQGQKTSQVEGGRILELSFIQPVTHQFR